MTHKRRLFAFYWKKKIIKMEQHLLSIVLIGIVGSIHCVGMCGGFVLALNHAAEHRKKMIWQQSAYHLGKTLTYMLLGLIAGGFGVVLQQLFGNLQYVLSVGIGVVLVLIGLGLLGIRNTWFAGMFAKWTSLTAAIGRQLKRNTGVTGFGVGFLNGFLPCGLVYGALAIAASTASAWQGALLMGVFGVMTIPALLTMAFLGMWIRPAWRSRLNLVSGILVIALGLLTVWRGLPEHAMDHDHNPGMHHQARGQTISTF